MLTYLTSLFRGRPLKVEDIHSEKMTITMVIHRKFPGTWTHYDWYDVRFLEVVYVFRFLWIFLSVVGNLRDRRGAIIKIT